MSSQYDSTASSTWSKSSTWSNPQWGSNSGNANTIITVSGDSATQWASPLELLKGQCFICDARDVEIVIVCETCRDVMTVMRAHVMKQMAAEIEKELAAFDDLE